MEEGREGEREKRGRKAIESPPDIIERNWLRAGYS